MQDERRKRHETLPDNRKTEGHRPGLVSADDAVRRVAVDRNIAELLVEAGTITRVHFVEAVALKKERGGTIIDALLSLSHLSAGALVDFLMAHPGTIGAYAAYVAIAEDLIGLVSPSLAQKFKIIPLDRVGDTLVMGAMDPLEDAALKEIEAETKLRPKVLLCSRENLRAAIEYHYSERAAVKAPVAEALPAAPPVEHLQASTTLSHVGRLIRRIGSLPALPETVVRVKQAMDNPASTVREIVGVITLDPPVAAKVLSVANSAAYGFRHRIKDVTHAISLLGFRETYGIVLSVAVADLANKLKHFDYRGFWLESMYSAAAARVVAKAAGQRRLAGVFSAGLLHDLGRIVLLELQPNYMQQISGEAWGRALVAEEERVIGLGHPEAGYELAQYWDLPPEIAEPIRFHHIPERATEAKTHVCIVALANVMACAPGHSLEDNPNLFEGYEAALEYLRVDDEIAEAMLDDFLGLRGATIDEPYD